MRSISCKEAVDFMLKKEEGKLSLWNQVKLWQHMMICTLCAIFYKQNKLINNTAKLSKESPYQLTADDKETIIRNVLNRGEK
jgi:hypothetical protein